MHLQNLTVNLKLHNSCHSRSARNNLLKVCLATSLPKRLKMATSMARASEGPPTHNRNNNINERKKVHTDKLCLRNSLFLVRVVWNFPPFQSWWWREGKEESVASRFATGFGPVTFRFYSGRPLWTIKFSESGPIGILALAVADGCSADNGGGQSEDKNQEYFSLYFGFILPTV